jgi:polyisoprenoid-binding protein YceI
MFNRFLAIPFVLAGLIAYPSVGQAETYKFNVHAKLTNISFESKMDVEDIVGSSNQVKGWVKRNSAGRVTFALKVPVKSLKTGIAMRDMHLRSPMWLNAKKFPHIQFKGTKATKLRNGKWRVSGVFTMHGVSRRMSVVVRVRKISAAIAARAGLGRANWLRLRTKFNLRLSHFGVKIPGMAAAKVNDKWTVKISLFAKDAS